MKTKNMIKFNYRKPRMKYGSKLQTVDGITFHSQLEARYYSQLKLLKRAGEIKSFERQVSFVLSAMVPHNCALDLGCYGTSVIGKQVCAHIVDFVVTLPNGDREVHEVKGFATDIWDLKRKIFEANYPNLPYKVVRHVR